MYQRASLRRLIRTAVATTAVALTTSLAAAPASAAGEREQDRSAATGWLVSQLSDGRFHNKQFDFDDWGLTVDGLFALAADPDRSRATRRVGRAVRNHVDDYTTYQDFSTGGTVRSAGATAKTLVAAKVLRADARSFGGHDLRAELRRLIDRAGSDEGRIEDSAGTDFSNTITQSYGVIGLSRSGGTPRSTVRFLLRQRCDAGYFRLDMTSRGGCERGGGEPNVDATALAVQALVAADRRGGVAVRDRVINRSGRWLAQAQRRNGSFGGDLGTSGSNSNSTGVAAQALALTGHDEAVRQAGRFVGTLQITRAKADDGPARRDLGAIAYDRAGLRQALGEGVTESTRDQFRRATTQAVFALKPAPLVSLTRR